MMNYEKPGDQEHRCKQSECGAVHADCPGPFKGTCERPPGHDGSHYCGHCKSYF